MALPHQQQSQHEEERVSVRYWQPRLAKDAAAVVAAVVAVVEEEAVADAEVLPLRLESRQRSWPVQGIHPTTESIQPEMTIKV